MKKIIWILLGIFSLVLVSCTGNDEPVKETITLNVDQQGTLELEEGDSTTIQVSTNDELGYTVTVENNSIVSVNNNEVTALKAGSTTIRFTAKSDETVYVIVNVTVIEKINLNVQPIDVTLWKGMSYQLKVDADTDVTFKSSNEEVVIVTEYGSLYLVGTGEATITVASKDRPSVKREIPIEVFELSIEGVSKANIGTERQLVAVKKEGIPVEEDVIWTINRSDLASLSDTGKVTFIKTGKVTVTAKLASDNTVLYRHEIVIVNEMVYDLEAKEDDVLLLDGLDFVYGERLFNNLQDLHHHMPNSNSTIRMIRASETEDLVIDLEGIKLYADNLSMKKNIHIKANNVAISGFVFDSDAELIIDDNLNGISVLNSKFVNPNTNKSAVIKVNNPSNLTIEGNEITNFIGTAIEINEFNQGKIIVQKNKITNVETAILVDGANYHKDAQLQLVRNDIDQVKNGFDVTLEGLSILAYARFNSVTNYAEYAAKTSETLQVDYTLNHWGKEELDLNDFLNVEPKYLRGHYETKESIISEEDYDPQGPAKIYITSDISEMWVNDSVRIKYEYLPYELKNPSFRFASSDADKLSISGVGQMTALRSGLVTVTISSSRNSDVFASIEFGILTDPGILVTPSTYDYALLTGMPLSFETSVFPYTHENEEIVFSSSDESIASINNSGVVTNKKAGKVTFTMKLANDQSVKVEYTVEFFDSLDKDNLLDLLTMNQLAFSEEHNIYAIGTGFSYRKVSYASVSLYYFGDVVVTPDIIDKNDYQRPGILKPNHPSGITQYNSDNVYWIVFHDTANTDPNSGALSHSNYLKNLVKNNTPTYVSWHYTLDDQMLIQHIPDNEIAYHAGDGSTLPGQGSYLGGGNRNGIGLETAVSENYDLVRIWQRTAKFTSKKAVQYNLPQDHIRFHRDFSGKSCPNTLFHSNMEQYFQRYLSIEYRIAKEFSNAQISMVSNNPDILDNTGRIISIPQYSQTVSYTVTVTYGGQTQSRTFSTFVPGSIR